MTAAEHLPTPEQLRELLVRETSLLRQGRKKPRQKAGEARKRQLVPGKIKRVIKTHDKAVAEEEAVETDWRKVKAPLGDQKLLDLLGTKVAMLVGSITPDQIEKASLAQRMTAAGIMFDKMRLLQNRPTAITSFEDRRSLAELTRALLAEAGRRGLVEGEFKDVTPKEAA
jgi:hypothetical protein